MSNLDTVIKDLVIANRILAREEVVDAYGHVSIRNPDNPKHFFLSRSVSPELVERDDIVELGLDGDLLRPDQADSALRAAQFEGCQWDSRTFLPNWASLSVHSSQTVNLCVIFCCLP